MLLLRFFFYRILEQLVFHRTMGSLTTGFHICILCLQIKHIGIATICRSVLYAAVLMKCKSVRQRIQHPENLAFNFSKQNHTRKKKNKFLAHKDLKIDVKSQKLGKGEPEENFQ